MRDTNQAIIRGAAIVAEEADASTIILAGWLPDERRQLQALLRDRRVISARRPGADPRSLDDGEMLNLPQVRLRRRGRAKIALLEALASGMLNPGERVVVISGDAANGDVQLDTIAVMDLDGESAGDNGLGPLALLRQAADPASFDAVLTMCVDIGHDGREGKPVGLLVTLGDHDTVLRRSHPLVLNPFAGHDEAARSIMNASGRRALQEFSGMDGAFIIRSDGVILAGGRYLQDVGSPTSVPAGLGARHRAAAGITGSTASIAFCVSESNGDTRVFGGGRLLMTIERND
ncbi:MAG TPA: diadenylate cyclase [Longimicrobiales bacterium]|nr:diadenylate cyclase [Longimicrobiales bacterium]